MTHKMTANWFLLWERTVLRDFASTVISLYLMFNFLVLTGQALSSLCSSRQIEILLVPLPPSPSHFLDCLTFCPTFLLLLHLHKSLNCLITLILSIASSVSLFLLSSLSSFLRFLIFPIHTSFLSRSSFSISSFSMSCPPPLSHLSFPLSHLPHAFLCILLHPLLLSSHPLPFVCLSFTIFFSSTSLLSHCPSTSPLSAPFSFSFISS